MHKHDGSEPEIIQGVETGVNVPAVEGEPEHVLPLWKVRRVDPLSERVIYTLSGLVVEKTTKGYRLGRSIDIDVKE